MTSLRDLIRRWLPERPQIPPCPTTGGRDYLEWQARYGYRPMAGCAAAALAKIERDEADEARLRRIIREELNREVTT